MELWILSLYFPVISKWLYQHLFLFGSNTPEMYKSFLIKGPNMSIFNSVILYLDFTREVLHNPLSLSVHQLTEMILVPFLLLFCQLYSDWLPLSLALYTAKSSETDCLKLQTAAS